MMTTICSTGLVVLLSSVVFHGVSSTRGTIGNVDGSNRNTVNNVLVEAACMYSTTVAQASIRRQKKPLLDLRGGAPTSASSNNESTIISSSFDSQKTTHEKSSKRSKKGSTTDSVGIVQSKKKKKKKNIPTAKAKSSTGSGKQRITEALREKDSAQALGDAIRERSEQWRPSGINNNVNTEENNDNAASTSTNLVSSLQSSVTSVGWALGASDHRTRPLSQQQEDDDIDAGGVPTAPTSIVVHYFLKSHGGAHALQCLCSVLAAMAGVGAVIISSSHHPTLQLALLRRCLMFAMIKHVSGLIAASWMTAQGIPLIGYRQAVRWMQELATDPVAQYTFYTADLLLWLPQGESDTRKQQIHRKMEMTTAATAQASPQTTQWWQNYQFIPLLVTGPVLLREIVSTLLVISDVLVLWSFSSTSGSFQHIQRLLNVVQSIVDAFMSLLVSPTVWRSAHSAQRQAILAKLTSKLSLSLEFAVGLFLTMDAAFAMTSFLFNLSTKSSFWSLCKKLLCTRLYLEFLWTRRRKIQRLATSIRGGAAQMPLYVLSVVLHPRLSMGLTWDEGTITSTEKESPLGSTAVLKKPKAEWTWKDYAIAALGIDE